jgi:hypothetical protein
MPGRVEEHPHAAQRKFETFREFRMDVLGETFKVQHKKWPGTETPSPFFVAGPYTLTAFSDFPQAASPKVHITHKDVPNVFAKITNSGLSVHLALASPSPRPIEYRIIAQPTGAKPELMLEFPLDVLDSLGISSSRGPEMFARMSDSTVVVHFKDVPNVLDRIGRALKAGQVPERLVPTAQEMMRAKGIDSPESVKFIQDLFQSRARLRHLLKSLTYHGSPKITRAISQ